MNKRLGLFLHVAFWAYMFLSPLTFMRNSGVTMGQYLMNCVQPLLLMVVFYANYLWLTPRLFVEGKHSYFLLINTVMVVCMGLLNHYWIIYTHELFQPMNRPPYTPQTIDIVFFIIRDIFNFAIFAAVATAIVLAMRWQHNEQARREAEAARTDAELSNLRSQINPHFLLNTLNNIYALTAFDAPKAQEAIQELSKMLRHALYNTQQAVVPLKEEVGFIGNYVKLMRIRLPESVDVSYTSDVKSNDLTVAPMIFISLVENAFKHGVSPVEPSFIHIRINATEEQIVCDITNSNHPKAASDHSGHGIGLQQVQRRLELAYPGHYSWERGVSDDGKTYRSCITIYNA